jgi:3-hydroxyacyl-CoA dehydrogenase
MTSTSNLSKKIMRVLITDKLLAKDVAKEKLAEKEAKGIRERVRAIGDLNELRDVDLVIEVSRLCNIPIETTPTPSTINS